MLFMQFMKGSTHVFFFCIEQIGNLLIRRCGAIISKKNDRFDSGLLGQTQRLFFPYGLDIMFSFAPAPNSRLYPFDGEGRPRGGFSEKEPPDAESPVGDESPPVWAKVCTCPVRAVVGRFCEMALPLCFTQNV